MKKGYVLIVVLMVLIIAMPAYAVPIGYYPGLQELIDRANAIVILRIDRHLTDFRSPTFYSTHKCYIYQTIKGNIPKNTRINLQLMNTEAGFVTPYAHGSTHLMFLMKKATEDEPTEYRTLTFKGAQILLSPLGKEKAPEGKTIEQKIKKLIRDSIAYQAKEHEKKQMFLKAMLTPQKATKLSSKPNMQVEGGVKGSGLTVFESYFPDDAEAGKKLDQWWENRGRNPLDDEGFFELFRKGLRRSTVKYKGNFLMQHIGGGYIWHKNPDDQRAVDIVYHASFSAEYKYYAVYSGLSVANPKSERFLKRLVDLAMEPHQLGRIIWGVKQSKQEDRFMILLEPYLQGSDPGKRERADVVVRAFKGEIDAGKWEREWNQQQKSERTIREFGDSLPRIKKTFLTGTSSERLEAIKFIRKNLVSFSHDQSFIRALDICAQDDDANVRSGIASILGGNYIWGKEIQSREVMRILLSLSHDENRDVRYNAVYYGLSVIKKKNKEVIERLVELALNDHENNLYGRIVWGLGGPTSADRELIEQVLAEKGSEAISDQHRKASLYFLYKELFSKEPPTVWGLKKAASHYENFFGIYLAPQEPFQPESTDELWQELSRTLPDKLHVQGFPDLNPNKIVIWVKVKDPKARDAVVRLIKESIKLRFKSSTPLPPPMILFLEEPQSIKHLKKVYEWPKNY